MHQQRPDDLIDEPKGYDVHHDTDKHGNNGSICCFAVLAGIFQHFLKQNNLLLYV